MCGATCKTVRKFKVAVTSSCTLRCAYCFVDKDADETIGAEAARAAVRFFLEAPGRIKKLEIYGGEPLLHFGLVRGLLAYAAGTARSLDKDLSVSVATNGLVVKDEHLEGFRELGAHLSVSFAGTNGVHDRFRRTADGKGSFGRIARNLPRMFEALGADRMDAILCVHPKGAGTMARDFRALLDLGFEHVNLEVVHGFPWDGRAREAFRENLHEIGGVIMERAGTERPVFADTFFDFLDKDLRTLGACPFYRDLEVFPDGRYSFYPFPFLRREERSRAAVGHALKGMREPFASCRFEPGSAACAGCREGYYALERIREGNIPYRERTRFFGKLLKEILSRAAREKVYQDFARKLTLRASGGIR